MSNSVAELVANCFNVSGVGGENPEKWKAVTAVSALEAKLEAMEQAITDGGRLKAAHFREWARGIDERNGYRGSVLSELLLRLAADQQEQEE